MKRNMTLLSVSLIGNIVSRHLHLMSNLEWTDRATHPAPPRLTLRYYNTSNIYFNKEETNFSVSQSQFKDYSDLSEGL